MSDNKGRNSGIDPDSITNVRIPTRMDGLWIEFADGVSGFVTWRDLNLEKYVNSLILDSVRIDDHGSSIEFDSMNGEVFDIDGLAIKTYLDEDAANRVATWIQRSDLALARRVRAARLKTGLTQRDLGERAGMDQAVISKLERGFHRPRIDTLRRIADALGLTVTDLLDSSPG